MLCLWHSAKSLQPLCYFVWIVTLLYNPHRQKSCKCEDHSIEIPQPRGHVIIHIPSASNILYSCIKLFSYQNLILRDMQATAYSKFVLLCTDALDFIVDLHHTSIPTIFIHIAFQLYSFSESAQVQIYILISIEFSSLIIYEGSKWHCF